MERYQESSHLYKETEKARRRFEVAAIREIEVNEKTAPILDLLEKVSLQAKEALAQRGEAEVNCTEALRGYVKALQVETRALLRIAPNNQVEKPETVLPFSHIPTPPETSSEAQTKEALAAKEEEDANAAPGTYKTLARLEFDPLSPEFGKEESKTRRPSQGSGAREE